MLQNKEDKKYVDTLKKMPIANKLRSAFELYDFARSRVAGEIKRQNPNISATELSELVQKRFYSR